MSEKKEQITVVEHKFIPAHELLSEEETAKLLEDFSIKKSQLPKIVRSDPAVRHLDAKRGNVIKIIRTSPTAGKAIYYRVVV